MKDEMTHAEQELKEMADALLAEADKDEAPKAEEKK